MQVTMHRYFLNFFWVLFLLYLINSPLLAGLQQEKVLQDTSQSVSISEGATNSLTDTLNEAQPHWSINSGKIFWSAVILLFGFLIVKYVTRLLESLAERWTNIRLAIKRLIPIFRIVTWCIVSYIIIADILAPPIATLVAVTASAGIAVGFASQDILKNIFGGIMILFDRPFQVGDKIEVGNHYGEVVSIGLRTVRVVTPDDSLVSIPNSEIVNQSVSNANSGESNCQVVADFYLPPNVDLVMAKKIAYRAAAVSRYIYLKKPIVVIIKNEIHQGRSLLKMRLKAYVLDIRYEFLFSSEMTETVITELLRKRLVLPEELSLIQPAPLAELLPIQ
ncbi:mechanosensitive ion channel [candidate division KSB1 bacterium]|nr:mechanosensitive ion channel [candidate division KSB1 bacterium]